MFLEENQTIPYAALRYTSLGVATEVPQKDLQITWATDFAGVKHVLRASEANYGGRVTDAHDRITISNLITDSWHGVGAEGKIKIDSGLLLRRYPQGGLFRFQLTVAVREPHRPAFTCKCI